MHHWFDFKAKGRDIRLVNEELNPYVLKTLDTYTIYVHPLKMGMNTIHRQDCTIAVLLKPLTIIADSVSMAFDPASLQFCACIRKNKSAKGIEWYSDARIQNYSDWPVRMKRYQASTARIGTSIVVGSDDVQRVDEPGIIRIMHRLKRKCSESFWIMFHVKTHG